MKLMKHANSMFPHDTLSVWLHDKAAIRRREIVPVSIGVVRQIHVLVVLGEYPGLGERVITANMWKSDRRPPVPLVGCVGKRGKGYHDSENNNASHQSH